jgi:hypothetical protein
MLFTPTHVDFEIAFGGESPLTDGTLKGLVSSMSSHVNLKGRVTGKWFSADGTNMLC